MSREQIEKQAIEEMATVILEKSDLSVVDIAENVARILFEEGYCKQSEVIKEYRKKVYSKMEKYTVFGREYIQRIMREVEKEMKGGAE